MSRIARVDPENDLEAWRGSVAGFDQGLWWRPIVCTHRTDQVAESELLGLVFEHEVSGETYWAPRIRGVNRARTLTEAPMLRLTRLNDDERSSVRERSIGEGKWIWFGRGSLNAVCPRGCEVRIAREAWDSIVETTRRVSPPWVDVSRYAQRSRRR